MFIFIGISTFMKQRMKQGVNRAVKEGTATFLEILNMLDQMDSNFLQFKISNTQFEQQRYAFRGEKKKTYLAVLSNHKNECQLSGNSIKALEATFSILDYSISVKTFRILTVSNGDILWKLCLRLMQC